MLPLDLIALAEARREAFEKELFHVRQRAHMPTRSALWQRWLGSGLVWTGARLVVWGEAVSDSCPRRMEVARQ